MKYLDEFRNTDLAKILLDKIYRTTTQPWVIMEICGGQTHSIMQYGIDQLLPPEIEMIHGPGCPVCVTALETVDKALEIASMPNVILCSFGDMLRVPGSNQDLFSVRAAGGQIKIVYTPLDAVKIAQANPNKEVVFFAIGFETTAPANLVSVLQAQALGLKNYSMLVSQFSVPPAMKAILSSPDNLIQGFLAAGHVCAVMGYHEYYSIATKYHIPIVVTGFEPLDILKGILTTVEQLEADTYEVQNAYSRVVSIEGNLAAQALIKKLYQVCDRNWRGIGMIQESGLCLRPEYVDFDAEKRFPLKNIMTSESKICISGQILQGLRKPPQCPAFGTICSPEKPLGATMVSFEGACAAYYRYARS